MKSLLMMLLLAGCSARQSGPPSMPTPPAPPSPPSTSAPPTSAPSPSTSSSEGEATDSSEDAAAETPTETSKQTSNGETAASSEAGSLSSVETAEERRSSLEGKLDASLEEFDGTIQREQEILDERRQASAPAGAGSAETGEGASEGSGEAGGGGTNGSGEASEGGDGAEEQTAGGAEGTGNSPDQPSGEPVSADAGSPEGGSSGPVSNRRVPEDVGDGRDDDIVARQIREAAMNEKDPELREKLWDEYRAYKSGQKKKD